MKINSIGGLKTVISNRDSMHNYFGWPTSARLKNGKIAVGASGFRLGHVCPFGKSVISYSDDISGDLGYPSTVELPDGSLLTAFYAKLDHDGKALILAQKWCLVK